VPSESPPRLERIEMAEKRFMMLSFAIEFEIALTLAYPGNSRISAFRILEKTAGRSSTFTPWSGPC